MGCVVEFNDPRVIFELNYEQNKQEILIDILLKYSNRNLASIAEALDAPLELLIKVHNGSSFLNKEQTDKLLHLFLVFLAG